MKYFIVVILLSSCLFSTIQARSPVFKNEGTQQTEKRFLGSAWNWINDNVINNINNHVINPVIDG